MRSCIIILRPLIACLLIALVGGQAFAWNNLGHKVVAEIAWQQLKPAQRQSIVDTVRRHPKFDRDFAGKMEDAALKGDKAVQDHWIFQHAATWPDVIRGDKEYDKPSWHYIDLPTYLDPTDRQAFAGKLPVNISLEYPTTLPREEYNAVQAIEMCKELLKRNSSAEMKAMAYCWLFHLVGDIHQPLHCTALFSVQHFPKGDKGGNYIKVQRGKNLHSLWDGLLGRQYFMRDATKSAAELSDKSKYGDAWALAGRDTDPRKWAEEGHRLCATAVYSPEILAAARTNMPGNHMQPASLPEAYFTAAGEVARSQVVKAGLRLAAILNSP